MKQAVYMGYKGLAWVILAVAVLQFFLAGLGAFEATDFGPHAISGLLLVPVSLVLLLLAGVAALTGSLSGGRVGMAAGLFVLLIVQFILGGPAQDISLFLAALHPVNGLLILVVAYTLARGRNLSQMAESASAEPSRVT